MNKICMSFLLLAASGCSFYARGPNDYQKAVRNVLDSKNDAVQSCYKKELEGNEKANGKVVVHFAVEPKTGAFTHPEVVKSETTADEPLQSCVLSQFDGLKLAPADARKGDATFAWNFER